MCEFGTRETENRPLSVLTGARKRGLILGEIHELSVETNKTVRYKGVSLERGSSVIVLA